VEKQESNFSFWCWFINGNGIDGKPGYFQYFDRIFFIYLIVGLVGAFYIEKPPSDIAVSLMLPVAGALFGVTFAWSGNITALLSTKEISQLSKHVPGGLAEYVYSAQAVVLIVLVTAVGWVLAGLGLLNHFIATWLLYTLTCTCFRECWGLILMAQYLTLARKEVADKTKQE
jgi:hypothetical protein